MVAANNPNTTYPMVGGVGNITGKEDWIHPSCAAVMANRRHLNDPRLTQIQDIDRYTKNRDKSLQNPEIKNRNYVVSTQPFMFTHTALQSFNAHFRW